VNRIVPTALAIGVGVITLMALFLDQPVLVGFRFAFVDWAAIVAVFALILGIVNIVSVHARRLKGLNAAYSAALILSFVVVLTLALYEGAGPGGPLMMAIFQYIQLPLESALMATLAIFLALAGFRVLRQQHVGGGLGMALLVVVALIVLVATIPWPGGISGTLTALKDGLIGGPAAGGARGLILGVALGAVATGLRLLTGIDRPQSE
jgi:hypothetical protein